MRNENITAHAGVLSMAAIKTKMDLPMDEEVYCIDFYSSTRMLLYGGKNNKCIAVNVDTGDVVAVVEDFDDSVVFCKFLDSEKFIVGSLDGTISLMTFEGEINNVCLNEDIARMKVLGDKIVVGTEMGNVHVLSLDLCFQNVCIGQHAEILDVCYENGRVYTLSGSSFMTFDANTHQKLVGFKVKNGLCLDKIPESDVVCIGSENMIVISKNTSILAKIEVEGSPLCVLYMNNYFVIGGCFEYILLVNIPMGMRVFKIPLGSIEVWDIKGFGLNQIVFSTSCGLVGHGDIRDEKSFRLFRTDLGSIFDLCFKDQVVYAAGENGYNVIDLYDTDDLECIGQR
ncbi:putative WD40-repeat protein [Ordospora pajunii]|uniref:putative WD40-repeat protein n=1 Tax=Ordospora pajunii TaxID=3039483 RepID=UPI0029526EB9|nr:putative WD40-repeat protein [Ordospora pajunii]KAH9412282.1 putative WD40-repeat protein [Ordospora pajunii]